MRMTQEKLDSINAAYNLSTIGGGEFKLNVNSSLKGTSVYRNNWEICDLSDLSTMIEELTQLRDTISNETGIDF